MALLIGPMSDVATGHKRSGCPASLQFSILILLIERVFGQPLAGQHGQGVAVFAKADDLFIKSDPTRAVEPCRQVGFTNGAFGAKDIRRIRVEPLRRSVGQRSAFSQER